jgi:hypothetical protein
MRWVATIKIPERKFRGDRSRLYIQSVEMARESVKETRTFLQFIPGHQRQTAAPKAFRKNAEGQGAKAQEIFKTHNPFSTRPVRCWGFEAELHGFWHFWHF